MDLQIIRINKSHIDELQNVFESSPTYILNIDGIPFVPKDNALTALQALPPNMNDEDKYVFLVRYNEKNIGAIDLIKGYPAKDTAFIGLLLLREDHQGMGLGRRAYELLERYILEELCLGKIQLSYIESNPVQRFWEKQGFYKTGDKKPYLGKNQKSFSQRMEKRLMVFFEPHDYQAKVDELYRKVEADLQSLVTGSRFEHIGASSVKGSVSKGDLDIFIGVDKERFGPIIEDLKNIGFREKENSLRTSDLCMLVTDKYNHDVALQVVRNGSQFEFFIKFRNFMISRPDLINELNHIKRNCRGLSPESYRDIKSRWIENLINQYNL